MHLLTFFFVMIWLRGHHSAKCLLGCTGVSEGDAPPSKAGKFCIFEIGIGIVQFDTPGQV